MGLSSLGEMEARRRPAWGSKPRWSRLTRGGDAAFQPCFGSLGGGVSQTLQGKCRIRPDPEGQREGRRGEAGVGGRVGLPHTIHYNSPQLCANCRPLLADYSAPGSPG